MPLMLPIIIGLLVLLCWAYVAFVSLRSAWFVAAIVRVVGVRNGWRSRVNDLPLFLVGPVNILSGGFALFMVFYTIDQIARRTMLA